MLSTKLIRKLPALLLSACIGIGIADGYALASPAKAPIDTRPVAGITSVPELSRWMTYYYMHPQPEMVVPAILFAENNNLLDGNSDGAAPLTAFISQIIAQNPGRVQAWTSQLSSLQEQGKLLLWTAMWWSNSKEAKDELNRIIPTLPQKTQEVLQAQIAKPAEPIEAMEINSPAVLDELWGCYCATGNEKYIERLLTALPWQEPGTDYRKMMIGAAAKWSLASNCEQHPNVMKFVTKARETRPELRKWLDPVIAQATGQKPTATTPRTANPTSTSVKPNESVR